MVNEKIQVGTIVDIEDDALISASQMFSTQEPFTVITVLRRSDRVLVKNGISETHWFSAESVSVGDDEAAPEEVAEVAKEVAKPAGRPRNK